MSAAVEADIKRPHRAGNIKGKAVRMTGTMAASTAGSPMLENAELASTPCCPLLVSNVAIITGTNRRNNAAKTGLLRAMGHR
ncbi:hypothetical protein [Mobilicoccus massiliensis]|uniref:hypothetical protein n=1 Tax=Mobilicoccus massiliensis TaxID=1522310 RepID=UPI001141BD10|nr:hypothetical protein [Mobilicoccus massiliensis]